MQNISQFYCQTVGVWVLQFSWFCQEINPGTTVYLALPTLQRLSISELLNNSPGYSCPGRLAYRKVSIRGPAFLYCRLWIFSVKQFTALLWLYLWHEALHCQSSVQVRSWTSRKRPLIMQRLSGRLREVVVCKNQTTWVSSENRSRHIDNLLLAMSK